MNTMYWNIREWIEEWMMKYLQKRGWVVFYLDEEYRTCSNPDCWINLYVRQTKEEAK